MPLQIGQFVDFREFMAEDRRRCSEETDYGTNWHRAGKPHERWRISYISATHELYATMTTRMTGGLRHWQPTVIVAKLLSQTDAGAKMDSWADRMFEDWVLDDLFPDVTWLGDML